MDQDNRSEATDRPMTRSERIAARKEAREELVLKMAAKKKKAMRTALLVGLPLAIIVCVVVSLAFMAGTPAGRKTDWKTGDTFAFTERWEKLIPPDKASGKAEIDSDVTITIAGTCKVTDVSGGVPTGLEIELTKLDMSGVVPDGTASLPMKIVAKRSGPDAKWKYEGAGLPEYCPLRADFLLTCGLDLPQQKWRKSVEVDAALPRWATPDLPVKNMPTLINYTCENIDEAINFNIDTTSHGISHKGDATIEDKKYRYQLVTKGAIKLDFKRNFITNFTFRAQGYVENYSTGGGRSSQNEDAPGFGTTRVVATRTWQ